MLRISVGLLLWFSVGLSGASPHIAFYYGANPPWDELGVFDIVVVEAAHGIEPARIPSRSTRVFAYVSVGEIESQRPYAKELPEGLVKGSNEPWRSLVVDQTHPEWPAFFLDRIVAPLWTAGFRGFFLDTLDSFQLISKTDEERAQQAQALARVIRAMRKRFPTAQLIFNRGFEILPELHREAYAVAAESLFRGWDAGKKAYVEVPVADREWLMGQLERVRLEYRLPVITIEYAPPGQRELARTTANDVTRLGYIPFVTNSDLNQVGVGRVEAIPRKVVMLYDGADANAKYYEHRIRVQAKVPFEKLGYRVDYIDVSQPLPGYPLVGRYAGIVTWFGNDQAVNRPGLREWLERQRTESMRMAVIGSFPFPLNDALAASFGLRAGLPRAPGILTVEVLDPMISPGQLPRPEPLLFTPLQAVEASTTLLRLRGDDGATMDAAALMPWGGYVLTPYDTAPVAAGGDRWLFEPTEFMRRALGLRPIGPARRASGPMPANVIETKRPHCEHQHNASERSATNCTS